MARLYLVRHAQASFGAQDYDQLSEHGIRQSAYIPAHFRDIETPALYRGDMQRHKQTADHSFPALSAAVLPGLNEFDHMNVLSVYNPDILDKEKITALIMSQSDPRKFMQDEFDKAVMRWMNDEHAPSYKEPFRDFKTRVLDTLHGIISTARREKQKEVVAVTSGGVISVLVGYVTDMPYQKVLSLNPNIANASVTSLLFNDHKTTLSYYNNFSHLPKEMVTFF